MLLFRQTVETAVRGSGRGRSGEDIEQLVRSEGDGRAGPGSRWQLLAVPTVWEERGGEEGGTWELPQGCGLNTGCWDGEGVPAGCLPSPCLCTNGVA